MIESTADLAFLIGRVILFSGCIYCAVVAHRARQVRAFAWLGVIIMIVGLAVGVAVTLVPSPVTPYAQTNYHQIWQNWSTMIFAIGVLDYLVAIYFGYKLNHDPAEEIP